ncbi:MAG: hypothetical protein K8I02_11505, partial [Candidatus Methylomirabilis sp.]|nr:hypothetical protein [Deltaproteobacteria bacterium]
VAVLHLPFASELLGVQPLSREDWTAIGLATLPLLLFPEVYKWIVHRRALRGPSRPPAVEAGA